MPICINCSSRDLIKFGLYNGQQKWHCSNCNLTSIYVRKRLGRKEDKMGNISIKIEGDKKIKVLTVDTTDVEKAVDNVTTKIEDFFNKHIKTESYTKDK